MVMRRFAFLLFFVAMFGNAKAVKLSDGGVTVGLSDVLCVLAGGVAGGATFAGLKALEDKIFSQDLENKNLYEALISVGVGAVVGVTLEVIVSYLQARGRVHHENYIQAVALWRAVSKAPLITCPVDEFLAYVHKCYNVEGPYSHALRDLDGLQKKLDTCQVRMQKVLEVWRESGNSEQKRLYKKGQKILEKVKECLGGVFDKIKLLSLEKAYAEETQNLLEVRFQINEIINGGQVASVCESFEKTVAHGLSTVVVAGSAEEFWPLIEVIRALRYTIEKINRLLIACVEKGSLCAELSVNDERYLPLVKEYNFLIERVKTDFPFDLFEQRIQEIFACPDYKEEIKILDNNKKHQEVVQALERIKVDLHGMVQDIKNMVGNVNYNVSELESQVGGVLGGVNGVASRLYNIENGIANVDSNVSTVYGAVSNVYGEVSNARGEISNVCGELSNARGEISNVYGAVSNVYGEVSNVRGEISNVVGALSNVEAAVQDLKD